MHSVWNLELNEIEYWPKYLRWGCLAVLLGLSAGVNWIWQIKPLQQERLALMSAEEALNNAANTTQTIPMLPHVPGNIQVQKKVLTLAVTHGVLLQEMAKSQDLWTLRFTGSYQGLQAVLHGLAGGEFAWDLRVLQWSAQPSLQLSITVIPITKLGAQQSDSYPYTAFTQRFATLPLLGRKNIFESVMIAKAPTKLLAKALEQKPKQLFLLPELLGIVGPGSGKKQAVLWWQGKTHVVQVDDRFGAWQVVFITARALALKNMQDRAAKTHTLYFNNKL